MKAICQKCYILLEEKDIIIHTIGGSPFTIICLKCAYEGLIKK